MKKLFIIEDDKDLCQELKLCLENAGYEANYLTNFSNTIEEINKIKPDLILLDIQL